MPRRFAPFFTLIAIIAIAACNATPAAPPISDPKEILSRTVLSLKDVKTVDAKGELTGTFSMSGTSLDLKGTTMDFAADIPGKKFKASASVPAFLGTSAEAIFTDQALFYKVLGPAAAMVGADPTGKYKKVETPTPSGAASPDVTDPQKAIDDFKAALDKLPTAPTKGANEKCGDQDCYHVTIKVTSDELKALAPTSEANSFATSFTMSVDVWSRTNDLRPAKLALGVDAGTQGNATLTFTLSYDTGVSIAAPPPDQIAP
jgi:hypothetical protein